jgi:hypothetical protein
MSLSRIALASLGGFIAYIILGGLAFGLFPSLRNEFLKYPAVYRNQEDMKTHMPVGMVAMFVSIVALSVIYAMLYQGGPTLEEGIRLGAMYGALIGIFFVGAFVVHNYVNLNIGLTLTLQQAVAYFIEWTVTGMAIGILYRPPMPH